MRWITRLVDRWRTQQTVRPSLNCRHFDGRHFERILRYRVFSRYHACLRVGFDMWSYCLPTIVSRSVTLLLKLRGKGSFELLALHTLLCVCVVYQFWEEKMFKQSSCCTCSALLRRRSSVRAWCSAGLIGLSSVMTCVIVEWMYRIEHCRRRSPNIQIFDLRSDVTTRWI